MYRIGFTGNVVGSTAESFQRVVLALEAAAVVSELLELFTI